MTEGMALERLAEEWLRLDGYFTLVRVPFKLRRGRGKKHRSNTDLDVVAYHPGTGVVTVVEVKAYGGPDYYPDWSRSTQLREWTTEFAIEVARKWKQLINSDRVKRRFHWKFRESSLKEIRLVLPGSWPDGTERAARSRFEDSLAKKVLHDTGIKVHVRLVPIHDLICEVLESVKNDKSSRRVRYADTALEVFRWLTRKPESHQGRVSRILWAKETA